MRHESHTLISIIRAGVSEWRKREDWSREAVVQAIVDTHERMGGPKATGIKFDPATRDVFERAKVNADRVFRWLDDDSKDSTLLPTNFLQSILGAMPMDIRMHCLHEFLLPLGIVPASLEVAGNGDFDASTHLNEMIKEGAEATMALVGVKPGAPLAVLENARKEVGDAQESHSRAARALDSAIAHAKAGPNKIRHLGAQSAPHE